MCPLGAQHDEGAIYIDSSKLPSRSRPVVWIPVRCPECGKLLCEVTPGSIVKSRCKQCRKYFEKETA